jgi:hypothetical protein
VRARLRTPGVAWSCFTAAESLVRICARARAYGRLGSTTGMDGHEHGRQGLGSSAASVRMFAAPRSGSHARLQGTRIAMRQSFERRQASALSEVTRMHDTGAGVLLGELVQVLHHQFHAEPPTVGACRHAPGAAMPALRSTATTSLPVMPTAEGA